MLLGFEHIGMTVSDLERSLPFYCGLLGLELRLRKRQADGSEVAFLDAGGGMLEIFAPAGGAARAVDVPAGMAGLRHLTLAVDDVAATIDRLDAAGVEITERPRPAFNTEMIATVAFCRDPDGILVELVERAANRR